MVGKCSQFFMDLCAEFLIILEHSFTLDDVWKSQQAGLLFVGEAPGVWGSEVAK